MCMFAYMVVDEITKVKEEKSSKIFQDLHEEFAARYKEQNKNIDHTLNNQEGWKWRVGIRMRSVIKN